MSWLSWYATESVAQSGAVDHPHAALINPVVAGIGAAFLVVAALRQAATAQRRHMEQTNADRQRHITESFSKATEQLGSDKVEVRLGGIYTLERISRESPDDYWTILETLCAFVRERARRSKPRTISLEIVVGSHEKAGQIGTRAEPPTDIAAALAVVVRRDDKQRLEWGDEFMDNTVFNRNWRRLNFRGTDLSGANFRGANLRRVDLSSTNLNEADFTGSNLNDANLAGAILDGADLNGVNLRGANLYGASLRGANFSGESLSWAEFSKVYFSWTLNDFSDANLTRVNLKETNLSEADLSGAILCGVNLSEVANGLSAAQLARAIGDAKTCIPAGLARPTNWSGPDAA